jgi:primosomal protein N' (replication factor Y) (superfamily II helicase)
MFAEVAIPKTTLDTLTYSIPDNLSALIKPGSLVKVELRKKKTYGVVIEVNKTSPIKHTKDILEVNETEFLPSDLLSLLIWAKKYYFTDWGQVLNLTIPQSMYTYKPKTSDTKKEIDSSALPPADQFSVVSTVRKIISSLKDKLFKSYLLYNPDNLESIEIYLRLIEETLRLKKSVIMLVPEIILTPKFVIRFKEQLGDSLFLLHSGLKLSERKRTWFEIRTKEYSVVLGTRSAIFALVKNLGLIIVDNEHDLSYKEQERHFHYNARDIAVVRAQMNNAKVILASPTPSCESFYNAQTGKYEMAIIPKQTKKIKDKVLLVDMRRSKDKVLSAKLKYEIQSTYEQEKNIVLFLNRRGFARVFSCFECGYIPTCPQCGIPLIFHSDGKTFTCHICKYQEPVFDFCPKCRGSEFTFSGIGTQKIESEIKKIIHNPDILRIDSDSEISAAESRRTRRKNLSELSVSVANSSKILITTRLGLSGLDYSRIGLFGVISADTTLFLPDFRSQERTFQELSKIIEQSSPNKECKIIIQTYHPDNFSIYLAVQGNYEKFFEQELVARKKLEYPPFMRLTLIKITSSNKNDAEKHAGIIMKKLSNIKNLVLLGPSLVPVPKRPNTFTCQILIKMKHNVLLSNLISYDDLASDKAKVDIDIDPM